MSPSRMNPDTLRKAGGPVGGRYLVGVIMGIVADLAGALRDAPRTPEREAGRASRRGVGRRLASALG